MNNFTLKMIAIITMLIDHIAVVLISNDTLTYQIMRMIGRLAFPIFCFLIVEGLHYTKNVYKYMLRLGVFAVLSEIPFDLALYKEPFYFGYQNVFFTLVIGLVVIHTLDTINAKFAERRVVISILQIIVVLAGCYLAVRLRTDYNYFGIILILMFYLFRDSKWMRIISVVIVTNYLGGGIEGLAAISMIFILLYNGKKGPTSKYMFYAFYPVHLFCLYLISLLS